MMSISRHNRAPQWLDKEPWGKAARATSPSYLSRKRAAGIHQVTWTKSGSILYENWILSIRKLLKIPLSTKSSIPKGSTFSLIGLTLRHGTAQCRKKCPTWICKFVLACKFDHSMSSYSSLNYVMSASSLTDMPVASPHPVGSGSETVDMKSRSSSMTVCVPNRSC
ncbi:hypothetical protein Bca52824_020342 [Brassica carinata]|uniref:Uncharacterized protein n=1 Tax=Brassica carinata TaxID=52824 RepID=A0A8X7VUU4_BRACI|nr:hypothetical protein Bca52824_020342 [Brassica carinata]